MAFTIYFRQVGEAPDSKQWKRIANCAKQILEENKDIVCLEYDNPEDPPLVDDEEIFFNGKGEDGHETFVLGRNMKGFNFCKTAQKPYTAAVVEILKVANNICPGWLKISDDGGYFS